MKIKGAHAAPALVIIVAALSAAANYLDISKISENTNPYLTIMILELCCLGLPTVFFCLLRGGGYRGTLRLRPMKLRHISMSVYALLLLISASIALSILMYRLFPEAYVASSMSTISGSMSSYTQADSIYAALAFGVLPALLEEFIFRSVVLGEYSTYGGACAVIMSSLSFAMLHFNPVRFPLYFLCGIILGVTVCATGSVVSAALIHTANNVFVLYFESYVYKVAGKHSGGLILLTFIVVSAMLIFAVMFFARAQRLYEQMGYDNKPSPLIRVREAGSAPLLIQALVSPTFIILVIFYLVASFLI